MRLEHRFTVPVPVDRAWHLLLDLPRVVPCMPGATLASIDGDAFTGTVKVKLGPITLTYRGTGRFVERDAEAHRVVVEANGKDVRAAGTAAATVAAVLTGAGEHTTVDVVTDLLVTGRPAQFGRGMIAEVSEKLLGQFTDCLAGSLGAPPEASPDASPDAATGPETPTITTPTITTPTTTATAPTITATTPATKAGSSGGTDRTRVATAGARTGTESSGIPPKSGAPTDHDAPVDLLRLTAGTATAKRLAKQGAGMVALLALAWLAVRALRR